MIGRKSMRSQTLFLLPLLALGACSGEKAPDPRGVEHDETLLSVSATGRSETKPDEARFTAGVSTIAASAEAATQKNNETMTKVTEALKAFGVAGKDLQTRQLTVNRIDWGANKGKYEAVNQVEVRVRAVDKAGDAVAATTQAGANVLSGPTLRVSDQEAATKSAYAAAYRAARARADAYAGAAGLKIDRVLTIRDGGDNVPPMPYYEMDAAANRTVAQSAAPPFNPGVSESQVSVRVDFALSEK
jgi:uncharacterized protein YggE